MISILDPEKVHVAKTSTLSWQAVAMTACALSFLAFTLWLFASKFDGSEIKSLLMMAGPVCVREFFPVLKRLLKPSTDAFAAGGQVE